MKRSEPLQMYKNSAQDFLTSPRSTMTGRDFAEFRKKLGLSQMDLAIEFGVSRATITNWERSDNPVSPLAQLGLIALGNVPECRQWHGKKY